MSKPSLSELAVGQYNYVLGNGQVFSQPNPMLFREVYKRRGIDDIRSSLEYQTEFMNIESLTGSKNILFLPTSDQQIVEEQRTEVNGRVDIIAAETELPLPSMDQPLYIDFNLETQTPNILATVRRYKHNPEVLGQLAACLADPGRLEMNQVGLFHEDVLTAVHAMFPDIAIHPDFQKRIRSSVHFVDKTVSVDMVNQAEGIALPRHATSRTCAVSDLLQAESFAQLKQGWESVAGCTAHDDTIVVKLGPDSGGEGVFLVRPSNFDFFKSKISTLTEHSMPCMLQEPVCVPTYSPNGLPTRTSLDFVIQGREAIQYVGSAGQISADAECTEYLGSTWSRRDDDAVLQSIGVGNLQNLCDLYAEKGYIGPIGFDFLMNEDGEYVYIFDCNPRRTANQFVYNMKDYMARHQISLHSLANVGRSGMLKLPDLQSTLHALKERNVLMTADNPQGVIMMPHLKGGYDTFFANYQDLNQIQEWSEALREYDEEFPPLYL